MCCVVISINFALVFMELECHGTFQGKSKLKVFFFLIVASNKCYNYSHYCLDKKSNYIAQNSAIWSPAGFVEIGRAHVLTPVT